MDLAVDSDIFELFDYGALLQELGITVDIPALSSTMVYRVVDGDRWIVEEYINSDGVSALGYQTPTAFLNAAEDPIGYTIDSAGSIVSFGEALASGDFLDGLSEAGDIIDDIEDSPANPVNWF